MLQRRQSRLARIATSIRSYLTGPFPLNSAEMERLWSGPPVSSGISVTEESALNFSAVWAAVSLISGDVASLPLVYYKRLGNGGKDRYPEHPTYRILHDTPNPEMTSMTFRRTLQAHALTWGNGYAEIERDNLNRPKYLWPIEPWRITPFREDITKRLRYRVSNSDGGHVILSPENILHIPGLGFDGNQGYSVISKARESIALGIAAERFGGTFFGNGSTFGGVLSHPKNLSQQAQKNLRESLEARHQGVERAHRFLILEEDMKFTPTGIPPDDAQFLQTRQFQITEIARWFNVPPHKIGDLSRATFSNIEQQAIDYFTTTLVHWLRTWEQELNLKLVSPLERNIQFAEHVVEGLLRGDAAGRAAFYSSLFNIGAITPNEIRSLENMNPLPGGDTTYVPLAMVPANRVDEVVVSQITKNERPSLPPATDADVEEDEDDEEEDEERERTIRELRENNELLKLALTEARAAEGTLRSERDDARQQVELLAADGKREYEMRCAGQERETALEARASQAETTVEAAQVALRACQAELATISAQLAHEREAHAEDIQKHETDIREMEAHYKQQFAVLENIRSEAAMHAVALEQEREEARAALVMAEARAAAREADVTRTREESERSLRARKDTELDRLARMLPAHRLLIVDVVSRMMVAEATRARKRQHNPESVREWVSYFYPTHREYCADALYPVVSTLLAWKRSDENPRDVARALADEHCTESEQQFRAVLDESDDFNEALERMLARWEVERPQQAADRLLHDQISFIASYQ